MQQLRAGRKRFSEIQRRRSTSSWCMIEICPAGPPKLMKPSLSQNRKAWSKLTDSARGRSCSTDGSVVSFIRGLFFHKCREQAIEDGAGSGQQVVVIEDCFAQPGQYTFDAGSFGGLNATDIQVMHQSSHAA